VSKLQHQNSSPSLRKKIQSQAFGLDLRMSFDFGFLTSFLPDFFLSAAAEARDKSAL
jgi:hypothetical protein